MLVRFKSSETGEMLMLAEVARPLLKAIGKRCTARGVITRAEMLEAAAALSRYVAEHAAMEPPPDEAAEAELPPMARPVRLRQRAWPLLNMLTRTAHARRSDSHILWEAPADFEAEDEKQDAAAKST
jgi:hypothetical protein